LLGAGNLKLMNFTMKKFLLFFYIISVSSLCFSQDMILRKNGNTIECNVLRVDSVNVHFKMQRGGVEVETLLAMDEVEKILYEGDFDPNTTVPSEIVVKPLGLTTKYYHNGIPLKNHELAGLLSLNKLAHEEYKKAQGSNAAATIFSLAGGFLVGWPVGTAIAGGEPNWWLAVGGAGLILLSIPMTIDAKEKVYNAVEIYNEGLAQTSEVKTKLMLGFSQNGIGIRLVF
jgi:hypothetical protein